MNTKQTPQLAAQGGTPEERLERLLTERQRELEEKVARLEESALDLERREGLLRDSRASLERLLRLGSSDLDNRELDLTRLVAELEAREQRLHEEEEQLARRRAELGAVELKRASLEQRERALEERERVLGQPGGNGAPAETEATIVLAFVPGPQYRLVELAPVSARPGEALAVEGDEYTVARVGPSPLPGDSRRCAYLVARSG